MIHRVFIEGMNVRPLEPTDSTEELTELLHRAYAPLAAAGMQFVATHQSVDVTRRRCEAGFCFVAEEEGRLVGTITLYAHEPESRCEFYRIPGHFHFGQFAVEPEFQDTGLGRKLLQVVEQEAVRHGATALALDTSEHASHLIALYRHLGFEEVGRVAWGEVVNYESVILSKNLASDPETI